MKTHLLGHHQGTTICKQVNPCFFFLPISSDCKVCQEPERNLLAECPAGSSNTIWRPGYPSAGAAHHPISQWGLSGHCVILGKQWSGTVYTFTDLCIKYMIQLAGLLARRENLMRLTAQIQQASVALNRQLSQGWYETILKSSRWCIPDIWSRHVATWL